ncbi:hypothetical protein P8A21_39735 (plasmid) [Streptomyces poriferorum]|uniref:hypothetical protein n=1 Tax=Streptomyces poriferorum TaxID=2798799 RepID=UPI00273D26C0|nr:hypothetical protein [Streptomyces sp. Alt1]WLQ53683.1 hypothetical protein P8A21_39735 [Streptomyces sp. Alt1]
MTGTDGRGLLFTSCSVCEGLADQDRFPGRYTSLLPGMVGEEMACESARLYFGAHLAQDHPEAQPPPPAGTPATSAGSSIRTWS